MKRYNQLTSLTLSLLSLNAFGSLGAATISWQTSQQIYPGDTNDSFVNISGVPVLAINPTAETPGDITLNGVTFLQAGETELSTGVTANGVTATFADYGIAGNSFGDGSFTSNGDIFNVIASGIFGAQSVTLTGLVPGQEYLFQVFSNDSRGGRTQDWQSGFSDGVTDFATSYANGTFGQSSLSNVISGSDPVEGEPSGDFIIGTFLADGPTQSFMMDGSTDGFATAGGNGGRAQINAIQLRAIPEPSSGLLTGLAGLTLLVRRRQ